MPSDPSVPEMQAGPRCAFLPKPYTAWFVLVLLSMLQGRREIGDSVLPRFFFGGGRGAGGEEEEARVIVVVPVK